MAIMAFIEAADAGSDLEECFMVTLRVFKRLVNKVSNENATELYISKHLLAFERPS